MTQQLILGCLRLVYGLDAEYLNVQYICNLENDTEGVFQIEYAVDYDANI